MCNFTALSPGSHSLPAFHVVIAWCSLWSKLTQAIDARDMEAATESKTAVEEGQREERRKRDESGQVHVPRFFQQDRDKRWGPKIKYVVIELTSSQSDL